MDSMNETIKNLRTILKNMFIAQFDTNPGIDNSINLHITEVQFIKCAIASLTGTSTDNDDILHDWACDLVDEIHNKFESIRRY